MIGPRSPSPEEELFPWVEEARRRDQTIREENESEEDEKQEDHEDKEDKKEENSQIITKEEEEKNDNPTREPDVIISNGKVDRINNRGESTNGFGTSDQPENQQIDVSCFL